MRNHMPAKQRVFAVAFMDLSGAYDSVDRELLFWKLEHQLGVAAHTLQTLRSLYCGNTCTVKVDGCCSLPFGAACGLRQGCPLSTTLSTCSSGTCPSVCARRALARAWPLAPRPTAAALAPPKVIDLGYADDAGLCGQTPEELQQLMDCYFFG
jgi:hypothetical protein